MLFCFESLSDDGKSWDSAFFFFSSPFTLAVGTPSLRCFFAPFFFGIVLDALLLLFRFSRQLRLFGGRTSFLLLLLVTVLFFFFAAAASNGISSSTNLEGGLLDRFEGFSMGVLFPMPLWSPSCLTAKGTLALALLLRFRIMSFFGILLFWARV